MIVDVAVIEPLEINLYSNSAADLSRLMKIAWDADTNKFSIERLQLTSSIIADGS
ncbi:hypothetical protein FHS43_006901 [Streptosporangium becharense]|uniref:Uncharacterized protein n=1 Tax=Streptosporangium becharense TaxID=1816182 RepID=A0A7W9IHU3_9ACTN|nr:hypothetical protein [Streptosporangium becharense]MBB2915578.1 hypothetical protein [Streptosporangium becharense]MBB5820972.1 hypothetical protein [Streptosporangium becharense]